MAVSIQSEIELLLLLLPPSVLLSLSLLNLDFAIAVPVSAASRAPLCPLLHHVLLTIQTQDDVGSGRTECLG